MRSDIMMRGGRIYSVYRMSQSEQSNPPARSITSLLSEWTEIRQHKGNDKCSSVHASTAIYHHHACSLALYPE